MLTPHSVRSRGQDQEHALVKNIPMEKNSRGLKSTIRNFTSPGESQRSLRKPGMAPQKKSRMFRVATRWPGDQNPKCGHSGKPENRLVRRFSSKTGMSRETPFFLFADPLFFNLQVQPPA
jgi:hypothetical protein